ncbi:nucleoside diphosphate-linked moiety X motif 8 isoform X2 [Girardinichthys multiradiatus]|uniref:nucleoside diphosphate-linked moiety X motif 8 isoform X2 n=1 Tax=Girardinichthys multiradiatus TaxID=208333 RepID=UPI001FACE28F|nr:nucleoside diphosphate-linked moiety X motif 8 isoform X2 [Girardinichthys multiradiatus]XP_047247217.1 nucleoside diphosphate-linked moiety X motif 8 isoform X2 [Girardinichthys multiradiatus]
MFRGSPILVWACPSRSSQLLRQLNLFAFSERVSSAGLEVKHIHDRRPGETREKTLCCLAQLSSLSADSETYQLEDLTSENPLSKAILKSYYHHPLVSTKTKVASNLFSAFWNCLINNSFWPWDPNQITFSLINKSQCNFLQNCLHPKHSSYSSFKMPALNPWILNQLHFQAQLYYRSAHQIRTVHQAVPRVADTWRDCMSPENENRCRQVLQANWKLYDMEKVRTGARQTQGKNKGKWASILVSLCYNEGGPAFLFTLRSSTLKGRHKGDVSFAGGKSDPSDRDVVATALREAREELGVTVPTERVWGVMKPLRDASGMMIAPVLANLGPLEELTFKPNPEEVRSEA